MARSHPLGRTEPESAALGALTKAALWFQFQAGPFTGPEVAEILITGWHAYEQGKPKQLQENV